MEVDVVRLPLTAEQISRGVALGHFLRRARGSRPLEDVATAAGISPETLRKIESGRIPTPNFFAVASVAAVLEVAADDLVRVGRPERDGDAAMPA